MLYKKYHRNFVSQFRKGTKFIKGKFLRWKTRNLVVDTVRIEPYVVDITDYYEVCMTGNKYSWILVTSRGQLAEINVV